MRPLPMKDFSCSLTNFRSGKYILALRSDLDEGHAIYLSLDEHSCSFSDINDHDPLTHYPAIRTFSSREGMIKALELHLEAYENKYVSFYFDSYSSSH
jgi:hypothetical protein